VPEKGLRASAATARKPLVANSGYAVRVIAPRFPVTARKL
jgi:hypothetical protein